MPKDQTPDGGGDGGASAYVPPTPTSPTTNPGGEGGSAEWDFSATPGFGLGQGWSQQQYNSWYQNQLMTDPAMALLAQNFGAPFISMAWDAYRGKTDDAVFFNSVFAKFPTALSVLRGANGPGGGGRRSGFGGGGGQTKAQQYAAAEAAIINQSQTFGIQLGPNEVKGLAKVVVDGNWSGDQLTDYLLKDPTKVTMPGTISVSVDQIKQLGKSQMVNVSDDTAKEWARRIASGEMDIATVNGIMTQQAMTEYGWAKEQLVAGATMRDILMPARDMIARELELGAENVDLMDDRYRDMAQLTLEDGTRRAATMTEVQRAARKDAGWAKTNNSARLASQVATMIRNVFEG